MSESIIYRRIKRPDPALIDMLRGIPVADLHDEMDVVDRRSRLMNLNMRAILPGKSFVGPAFTAWNTPGDNLMMHAALYYAQPGDVLVVSNGGVPHGALWGGNASVEARRKGVVALVCDGPVRDIAQVRAADFGVWATSVCVGKPSKKDPGNVNLPIICAGVTVRPGDIVVGDEDGVIVIAPEDAARLATAAKARIKRDDLMQAAIDSKGSALFEEIAGPEALVALNAKIIDDVWREAP